MRLLLIIALIAFILWILGFAFNVATGFIHILLVIAVILFLIDLIDGRRRL